MNVINKRNFLFCFSLFFFAAAKCVAQDDFIVMEVDENNTPSFYFESADPSPDRLIWFFGDGHYSFTKKPKHNFGDNDNHVGTITLYHIDRYKPLPPSLVETINTTDQGNSFVNPSYNTESFEPIGVDVSPTWDPVEGDTIIYTTLITNNEEFELDGTLEFKFPNDLLDQLPLLLSQDINNDEWFTYQGTVDNAEENTTSFLFNVNPIPVGMQRLLHLRFKVFDTAFGNEMINTEAIVRSKRGDESIGKSSRRKKGSPHDPNFKWRDKKAICELNADAEVIEYEIHYQNEGDGFATRVGIFDFYSNIELIESYDIWETSLPLSNDYIHNNKIVFKFNNVMLPGSNQNYPIQYSFEQSQGVIKYRVYTKPCLVGYEVDQLTTFAKIGFNAELPVTTDEVFTSITRDCSHPADCQIDEENMPSQDEGTNNHGNVKVDVYPNPHTSELNISLYGNDFTGDTNFIIYNAQGVQIDRIKKQILENHTNSVRIDTHNWNLGVHLIIIENGTFRKSLRCIKMD